MLKQSIALSTHVAELTKPLESVGVIGFFYLRIDSDGSFINLASRHDWAEYYFQQLYQGAYHPQATSEQLYFRDQINLWSLNPDNQVWSDAARYFGLGNGIFICEENQDTREITGFYSTTENRAMNHFYINNLDSLKKFKHYFVSKAEDLIRQGERCKLVLPTDILQNKPVARDGHRIPQHELLSQLGIHETGLLSQDNKSNQAVSGRISVIHKNTGLPIKLSPQRSQCLLYLMQGKSTKEIATNMWLASKTVEHYLEFIRKELGCRSSKELILAYAHQII